MRLKCNWRGNKILNVTCRGDQMAVDYGGTAGPIPVCEAHAKALQAASPFSGAEFVKTKKAKHGEVAY